MIDLTTWQTALAEASTHQPEGFTTRELMHHLKLSEDRVRAMLRKMMDEGLLAHVGYKQALRIDGHMTKVPVYQVRKRK